jgi:hypothetical protein
VAAPCVEFTSYLLGSDTKLPRDQIKEELAFLDGGTRGYIVDVEHFTRPATLEVDDEVFLRSGHS